MIGTSDRISLVNQIWPNKRRGWEKKEEKEEDEENREVRGLRAGGSARTVALRACISMREGCEKGTLDRRRDARRGTREKDAERGTKERRSRRGAGAGGQEQKGWQEGTFRTFFVC